MTPAEIRAVRNGVPVKIARAIRLETDKHPKLNMSLAVAVCEQESGFRNVWGHDAGKFRRDGEVDRQGVAAYYASPPHYRPNGCGPMQITSPGLQSLAGAGGGLWIAAVSTTVGVRFLGQLVAQLGEPLGVERYNGSGPAARAYSARVRGRAAHWHTVLTT